VPHYCPVNESLPVSLHKRKISKGSNTVSGRQASLWRPAIHVSGHSWHLLFKSRCSLASRLLLVTPFSNRICRSELGLFNNRVVNKQVHRDSVVILIDPLNRATSTPKHGACHRCDGLWRGVILDATSRRRRTSTGSWDVL